MVQPGEDNARIQWVRRARGAPVISSAPRAPADCFSAALEAARIAVTYRTPVILLSDDSLAIGSEPWRVPDPSTLRTFDPTFATGPNAPDGSDEFWPYLRDDDTLSRPWAIPGTPRLEHRHRRPGEGRRARRHLLRSPTTTTAWSGCAHRPPDEGGLARAGRRPTALWRRPPRTW